MLQHIVLTITLCLFGILGCGKHEPSNDVLKDSRYPQVLEGAVIYVSPRNNEIIPNGDYNYVYHIEFTVDRDTTIADLQDVVTIAVPKLSGSGEMQLSPTDIQSYVCYTGVYYTASFSYAGNYETPQALVTADYMQQVQICGSGSSCSDVNLVDVIDVKRSVGFEAISRAGFGYGLYVSLLLPDYEMQPVDASTFFSSKDPGLYNALTPLWDWSEVDWEFVPMNSTLAGRNEVLYCPQMGQDLCLMYWTNM